MDGLQKFTKASTVTPQQNEYISFVAVSGLIIHEDGTWTKMTTQELADKLGVTRMAMNKWSRSIPNFAQLVEKRRTELYPTNRISAIWKALQLRAMAGNVDAAKIVLGQYAQWQPPSQKHEIRIDGIVDVLQIARLRRSTVEGEVVDASTQPNP